MKESIAQQQETIDLPAGSLAHAVDERRSAYGLPPLTQAEIDERGLSTDVTRLPGDVNPFEVAAAFTDQEKQAARAAREARIETGEELPGDRPAATRIIGALAAKSKSPKPLRGYNPDGTTSVALFKGQDRVSHWTPEE